MRRRLTDEEREIRSGAGIPWRRWWPIPLMVVMVMIVSLDSAMFERCLGTPLEGSGRGAAAVRMLASVPCSPFLLAGSPIEWLLFVPLWVPLPFAILNWRWRQRHRLYWHGVRQREAERRAERAEKAKAERAADD